MLQYSMNPLEIRFKLLTPHEVINAQCQNDITNDALIMKALQSFPGFWEDEQGRKSKQMLIEELTAIIRNWLNDLKNLNNDFEGDVQVFGSHRLQVNAKDGDIDLIVIAPDTVDREIHFFGQLSSILALNPKVTCLFQVQEAMVPLIKFKFSGTSIDLIFAAISKLQKPLSSSPTIDEKSSRSLTGLKVSDYFAPKATLKFIKLLKVIKLWAMNRGVYGGAMGYLGGISWQILVAKILQLYPNFSLTQQLERFFFIYSHWKWNDIPLLIEKSNEDVWRSYQPETQMQKTPMTVLTPIYPNINSTYNVSQNTLKIILDQFMYTFSVIQKIKQKELPWTDLFKKIQFFDKYTSYLQIRALAQDQKQLTPWRSHIEAKLRKLNKLFDESNLLEVHLYPKSFETNYTDDLLDIAGQQFPYSESFYYGLKPIDESRDIIDIDHIVRQFVEQLEGQRPYLRVPLTLNIQIQVIQKDSIPKKLKYEL